MGPVDHRLALASSPALPSAPAKKSLASVSSPIFRGLQGVKLVISDAHTGLKAAIARVFDATWQRCRVHWIRNALAHVPKGQHTVVAAAIRQALRAHGVTSRTEGSPQGCLRPEYRRPAPPEHVRRS